MADITMCTNTDCPLAPNCYRVQAPVNPYRQTVSEFPYITDANSHTICDYYWPMEDTHA